MAVRTASRKKRKEKGQSIVEMALAFPVLLLILAAVVDMGRALDAYIAMTNAVREGARYGAKYPTRADTIRLRVANEANGSGVNITGIQLETDDVTVTYPSGSMRGGHPIRVTAEHDLQLYFGGIIGLTEVHLVKSADMAIMTGP